MSRSDSRIEALKAECPACGMLFHPAMLEYISYLGTRMWCCLDCLEVRQRFKGYVPVRKLERAILDRKRKQARRERALA